MTGRHHVSARRRFGLRRPQLKPVGWILLACLVADAVVVGSLGVSDLAVGPESLPSGATAQLQPASDTGPASPPARVCGNSEVLGGGPRSAPAHAISVPAGDDTAVDFSQAHATYWFA